MNHITTILATIIICLFAATSHGNQAVDLSAGVACTGGPSCNYGVERTYHEAQFDTIGSLDYYTDSYRVVEFKLDASAKVIAQLLDGNGQEKKTIIAETTLNAGTYNFIVDYPTGRNRDWLRAEAEADPTGIFRE